MSLSTMTPSVAVAAPHNMFNMSDTSLEKQQPSPVDAASEDGVTAAKSRLDELEERSRSNRKVPSSMTEEEAKQCTLIDLIERKEWRHVLTKLEETTTKPANNEAKNNKSDGASIKQNLTLGGHETKGYPLHLALSKKPPTHVIQSLIDAYPDAVKSPEDKWGRLPLHIACIFTASAQVLQLLVNAYSESLRTPDEAEGRLPVHYACLHGSPFEIAVLVDSEPRALIYQDLKLKTPLDLAQESSNPHREAILERLEGKTHVISEKLRLRRRDADAELQLRDAATEIVEDKQKMKKSSGGSGSRRGSRSGVLELNKNQSGRNGSSSSKSLTLSGIISSSNGSGVIVSNRRSMSNPKERIPPPTVLERSSPSSASADGTFGRSGFGASSSSRVKDWKTDFEKSISLSAAFLVQTTSEKSSPKNTTSSSLKTPKALDADPWDLDRSGRATSSSEGVTSRRSLTIKDLSALVVKPDEGGGSSESLGLALGTAGQNSGANVGVAARKSKKSKGSGKKGKKEKKEKKEKKHSSSTSTTPVPAATGGKFASQKQAAQALMKGIPPAAAAGGMTTTTAPNKGKPSRPKKQRRSLTTDDLQRFDRETTTSTRPRLANSMNSGSSSKRSSKPRGLGNYLEADKKKQESKSKPQDLDHKSMGALSLPTNLFSQPLLEEAFEESESHLDNEDGFIFQETLQMMLNNTTTSTTTNSANATAGAATTTRTASSMISPGSSQEVADRLDPELIKLEAQIRNLDVRKEALTQETTNLETNVRRKKTEAQTSRERIASLQAKLLEVQVKLEKEKRSLELTMMNIQVQEETLNDHRSKIESVENERKKLVTKKEEKLGEQDDVRSRKQ